MRGNGVQWNKKLEYSRSQSNDVRSHSQHTRIENEEQNEENKEENCGSAARTLGGPIEVCDAAVIILQ